MTDHINRVAEVLIQHTRTSIEFCYCGWSDLGQSHAEHVARALDAAGLLAPDTFTKEEAYHGVERVPEHSVTRGDGGFLYVTDGEEVTMTDAEYGDWLVANGARVRHRWVTEWADSLWKSR